MDRRTTSGVTLAVLAGLCLIGLVFGAFAVTADFPKLESAPKSLCEPRSVQAGAKVRVGEVTVSVFNAGSSSGAASKTMQKLIERGFGPGDRGNAPKGTRVGYAQVWVDDAKNPAARLVARQFGPKTRIVTGKETLGAGVVVVVGNRFKRLNPGAPKLVRAAADTTICSPPLE